MTKTVELECIVAGPFPNTVLVSQIAFTVTPTAKGPLVFEAHTSAEVFTTKSESNLHENTKIHNNFWTNGIWETHGIWDP